MSVCDWPIVSNVCDVAGEAAATVAAFPFELIASAMGGAAEWLFEAVWDAFDATTLVDVTRPEYVAVYNIIFGIAVSLMLLFFCLQLITGLVKRDPTALSRAVLGLAKSVLGSFVVITLVALALEITDQLCIGIIQAAGETVDSMGGKISILVAGLGGITMAAPGVGAVLIIFLAGLAIAAAAIVWLSLLVRKALLLVAIALAPLAFSGSSWDAAKGWISKWAMFVLALVLSKLVLVIIFLIAITQVSAPIFTDLTSVSDPLAGIVLMALAGFSPYMVYRFLSFVGVDLYNQIGAEQEAKSAVNRPVPIPTKPSGDGPKKVLDTNTSDKPTNSPPSSSAPSSGPASSAAPAATATAGEGTAAAGGAAVAAPVAAVVVAKEAATAGPKAGTALAAQGEQAADAANQNGTTPPPPNAPAPASSAPAPSAPAGAPRGSEPPPPPPPPVPKTPPGKE
ncbi:conjugal transfer protein TrbL [Bifidobacterium subtile]|jgi:hypothetical protein|uniref:conjugal transfer protein TrbL n=1 Tax=Bifidobacterium subtile TaxID=77635 RepID=UPI002F357FF4